jgi:hypothetical protein
MMATSVLVVASLPKEKSPDQKAEAKGLFAVVIVGLIFEINIIGLLIRRDLRAIHYFYSGSNKNREQR